MAGYRIKDLPKPKKGYRVGRDTRRADGKISFESKRQCRCEDAQREKLILSSIRRYPDAINVDEALDLAGDMDSAALEDRLVLLTMASSLYMRKMRSLVIGNLWPLVENLRLAPARTATLLPTGMWVPASDLDRVDPNRLMHRLRRDCQRVGIDKASGYLIAVLHAEFDVRREGYDFHYHLVAGGEKAWLLERLRCLKKYSAPRSEPWEQGMPDRPRVWVSSKPLNNLPDPLTYILKSYYPHRPTKLVDGGPEIQRSEAGWRIPEPFHTQWLLWMNRWTISDHILLIGLRPSKQGFVLTHQNHVHE